MRALLLTLTTCLLVLPAYAEYSGGTGEPNDPYEIATAADLIALGETPADYGRHFVLTADIDLDPNLPGRKVFDRAVIAPDTDPVKWGFQGTPFAGVFDGNDHTISHLKIAGEGCLGLVGRLEGELKNLHVADVSVVGSGYSQGGLVGENYGSISASSSTGLVSGGNVAGGLVGQNGGGRIAMSYSAGSVSATDWVGGLVGYSSGSVFACYSTATASGTHSVGGLVGESDGSIFACYSTATASGTDWVGGLVGVQCGPISASYSTGYVSGTGCDIGGLVGSDDVWFWWYVNNEWPVPETIGCFWDIETSGQATSNEGTGRTTAQMQDPNMFMAAGWDFVGQPDGPHDIWAEPPGGGYPILCWQVPDKSGLPGFAGGTGEPNDPYRIATAKELNSIACNPRLMQCHYKLVTNLDLTGVPFHPIGSSSVPFQGSFNGNGHTISHLTITGESCIGLFGLLESGAEITKLGIVDANVVGLGPGGHVGVLAGFSRGVVTQCYSTGSVSGISQHVGGLVGVNYLGGSISSSYSIVGVGGSMSGVGGLIGLNLGTLAQCYSASTLNGMGGGLVGSDWLRYGEGFDVPTGTATACFWDTQTSTQLTSVGGTGKTTVEMKTAKTFLDAGWDFVGETANGTEDIWKIAEGLDYPRLWWEPCDGRVTVVLGQIFTVTLESNPSTGYRWEWVDDQDSIVEQMGEAQFKPRETGDPPLVGAGGWESFDFKAVNQGQMTLKLVYRRPWEEGVEPLKTFSLQVTVP
jgi:predicted secreted protein